MKKYEIFLISSNKHTKTKFQTWFNKSSLTSLNCFTLKLIDNHIWSEKNKKIN